MLIWLKIEFEYFYDFRQQHVWICDAITILSQGWKEENQVKLL